MFKFFQKLGRPTREIIAKSLNREIQSFHSNKGANKPNSPSPSELWEEYQREKQLERYLQEHNGGIRYDKSLAKQIEEAEEKYRNRGMK